jgi:ABC-type amino acid transport substrate-binding protein
MCKHRYKLFLGIILIVNATVVSASTFKVGVTYLLGFSEKMSDPVPLFAERLGQVSKLDFNLTILPTERSLMRLKKGKLDLHLPFLYLPSNVKNDLPFQYTTATFFKVNMVLYVHKDSSINLSNFHLYKMMTERAHIKSFDFEINPTSDMESAIRMVEEKRFDGLIFVEGIIDPLIRKHKLKNIKRIHHSFVDVKGLIRKGRNADLLDKKISKGVNEMIASGELAKITGSWSHHDDWQPYLMNW